MKFEQIAIVDKGEEIRRVWEDDGHTFIPDIVKSKGVLRDTHAGRFNSIENEAALYFNYTVFEGMEFELIKYNSGANFLQKAHTGEISHFGVHVPSIENIDPATLVQFYMLQEVVTHHHSSAAVGNKHYHYQIWQHAYVNMRVKFIERIDEPEQIQPKLQTVMARYL